MAIIPNTESMQKVSEIMAKTLNELHKLIEAKDNNPKEKMVLMMSFTMVALGKVDKLQLVKIQSTQSVANSVEPNFTHGEVTNYAKLKGGMYWVVTQVKDVSSEINNIVEVDMFHCMEDRMCSYDMASNYCSTGVPDHDTIQDGIYLNLGDPLHSCESEYFKTSCQERGLKEDAMEVGLTHSTLSMGKPCTWGRGQQYSVSLSAHNSLIHGG